MESFRLHKQIDLGRTNKIIIGNAADRMGPVPDTAGFEADLHLRVMVFMMGNPGSGVNESNRFVIIMESEGPNDFAIFVLPPRNFF
jgi:hypothetical protein